MPDLAATLKKREQTLELTAECLTAAERVIDGLLHSESDSENRRRVVVFGETKRRLAARDSR